MRDIGTDRSRALHERRFGPESAARRDAQKRDRDEGREPPHVLRAARHVDVVDQQLDIARPSEQAGQHGDRHADEHEDHAVEQEARMRRPQHAFEQVQQTEVGGADHTAQQPGRDHDAEQARARVGERLGELAATVARRPGNGLADRRR